MYSIPNNYEMTTSVWKSMVSGELVKLSENVARTPATNTMYKVDGSIVEPGLFMKALGNEWPPKPTDVKRVEEINQHLTFLHCPGWR